MIALAPVTVQHTARVASLRAILDATEAVDSYCVDYLTAGDDGSLIVDRDALGRERIDHVQRTLAELDAIVSASAEIAESGAVTADAELFAVTVRRAHMLSDAIREAMGQPITTMTYDPAPWSCSIPECEVTAPHNHRDFDEFDEGDEQAASPFAPKSAYEHTGFEAGPL
jgi:hypothetical protein